MMEFIPPSREAAQRSVRFEGIGATPARGPVAAGGGAAAGSQERATANFWPSPNQLLGLRFSCRRCGRGRR
jgi:hypothetical protein